jgi:cytoskeletal protein RodZ
MFAIGDSLREARTRRGLTPADVHKSIRIRERYLTALEEEHWEILPGEAYTKGFLRTYAEYLGLNGNLYIDEYNTRFAHHDEEPLRIPDSLAVSHRTRRGVLRMLMGVFLVGATVAGLASLGMGGSSAGKAKAHDKTTVTKHVAGHTAAAAATTHRQSTPAVQDAALASTTTISTARGSCWLAVRTGGPAGPILFEGVLEQGKKLHYPLKHPLWVRMGRPGNVDITLGGRRVNGLPAEPGNVLLTRRGSKTA